MTVTLIALMTLLALQDPTPDEVRRRIGEKLLKAFPGAEETILRGPDEARLRLIFDASSLRRENKRTAPDIGPLLEWAAEKKWTWRPQDLLTTAASDGHPAFEALILPLLAHAEPEIVIEAIRALVQRRAVHRAPEITALLRHRRSIVRRAAIEALGKLRAPGAAAGITDFLFYPRDEHQEEALAALALIGARDQARRIARYIEDLRDSGPEFRDYLLVVAVSTIGPLGGPEHAALLEPFLGDAYLRDAAIVSYGRLAGKRALPQIRPFLADGKLETRVAALEALGFVGAEDAAADLLPFLSDKDERLRTNAAAALVRIDAARHRTALLPLLKDESILVRHYAAEILGWVGHAEDAPAIAALGDDLKLLPPDDVLARMGPSGVAARVAAALGQKDANRRAGGVRIVCAIGGPEQLPAVLALCQDKEYYVRLSVACALPDLAPRITRPEDRARAIDALKALERLEDSVTLSSRGHARIARFAFGDAEPGLLRAAFDFLDREGGRQPEGARSLQAELYRRHEDPAWLKLCRKVEIAAPVETAGDLRKLFEKEGLRLEIDLRLTGTALFPIPRGSRASLREAVEWVLHRGDKAHEKFVPGIVPEGDRVRVLPMDEALELCRTRYLKD